MAFSLADRVRETSTTEGTAAYVLDGAVAGFQSFSAAIGDGNVTYYAASDGVNWEVGLGQVTVGATTTLSRDTILGSSNGGAKVDWGTGIRDIRCVLPAGKAVVIDDQSLVTLAATLAITHATTATAQFESARSDSGTIGKLSALANNASSSKMTFASILFNSTDLSAGAEEGTISLQTTRVGALATRATVKTGIVVGSPWGDDKGAGAVNAEFLYADGRAVAPAGTYPDEVYRVSQARWADADPLEISADTYLNGTHRGRLIIDGTGVTAHLPRLSAATGTAQAGSATTITLASGDSSVDNHYAGFQVTLTGGTGSGQTRNIVSYNGTTKVATVDRDWDQPPDSTSAYSVDLGGDVVLAFLNVHASNALNLSPASGDAADLTALRPNDAVIMCGDRASRRWRKLTNRRAVLAGTPLVIDPYAQGWYTGAHGLQGTPQWFNVEVECLAADLGYSVGDIVILTDHQTEADASFSVTIVSNESATTIGVYVKGLPRLPNKSTGDMAAITDANWKLRIVPFLLES